MFKKLIAVLAATLSMANAMDPSIQDGMEPKPLEVNLQIAENLQLEELKFLEPFSKEFFGEWYDFVNHHLDGKLEELRPNLEEIEISIDCRNSVKMDKESFEKNKSNYEDIFRKIKKQYQNPNDFTGSPVIPTLVFGIPDGFDVVDYCDEVLERGITVNDFFQPRVKVNYKARGEGANLAKLDKLLEHYAKSEWMEIALFDNLPVIEKVDLTSYLNKYRLEFDTGLRRLLHLKCPNLKEMSYQK